MDASILGRNIYNFIPILLIISALYALTWVLSVRKIIRPKLHRKIWNIILLVTALISLILGVLLIINLDFDAGIRLPFNLLYWHVEAGIAMGIIVVFHVLWNWRYFLNIFKGEKEE